MRMAPIGLHIRKLALQLMELFKEGLQDVVLEAVFT